MQGIIPLDRRDLRHYFGQRVRNLSRECFMAQLLFRRGDSPVFRIALQSSSTKIGRASSCDLVLSDPEISREHLALYKIEGRYHLKKLGQIAPTVNGQERDSHTLKEGDRIGIGPWIAEFSELGSATEFGEMETLVTEGGVHSTQAVACGPKGILVRQYQLQLIEPSKAPRQIPIRAESLTLGAAEKNDVVLQDAFVSSRHAKLTLRDGRVQVFDLGSTNGTYVNGVKIQSAELDDGQILKLGQCEARLLREEHFEQAPMKSTDRFCGMVGGSLEMRELYGLIERVAPSEAGVLILGESGTGKELVARAVHGLSPRSRGPLVTINCGAISSELIESELFGHEKGAFTGALRQHDGAFGQARGGTLFLDEIGELPLELQPKLLRVLENRSYRRVGGTEELCADVRVVAATHQDLAKAVQEKRFREDLFFRLFVMPVYLPPLRDRKEDLALLCERFLLEFSPANPRRLSSEAFAKLNGHDFPGNVRELRNVLLRAVILARGESLSEADISFPHDFGSASTQGRGLPLESLETMEKRMVLKALVAHDWNKAKAAEVLGVAKSTLFAKIKLYDIQEPKAGS